MEFKEQKKKEFEMSDLGLVSYYLGIEVSQQKWRISLRETAYAKKDFKVDQVTRMQLDNFTNGT